MNLSSADDARIRPLISAYANCPTSTFYPSHSTQSYSTDRDHLELLHQHPLLHQDSHRHPPLLPRFLRLQALHFNLRFRPLFHYQHLRRRRLDRQISSY
jgi:hypothetical protein